MDDSFYLVLPSNASSTVFPDNKISHYRVRLPFVHELPGSWEIALTEISYTRSWFNIAPGNYVECATNMGGTYADSRRYIEGGNYETIEQLLEAVNKQLATWKTHFPGTESAPELDLVGDKIKTKTKGLFQMDRTTQLKDEMKPVFSKALADVLGIDSDRPASLETIRNLYVYSDIVKPIIVGDQQQPLLRVVNVRPSTFGTNVTEIFERPYYVPVNYSAFQEIAINIVDDNNINPHFQFGRVTLTLHMRPE